MNPYFRGLAAAIMTGLTVYQYPQVSSLAALLNCQGAFPILYGVRAARFGVGCFPFVIIRYHTFNVIARRNVAQCLTYFFVQFVYV